MRSTIASSPFGPLFSDHIAGCHDLHVADIDAAMTSIPLITGYCPSAWQKAVDVMIPKKQTSTHVFKLRIIVLFHSMFNMINKRVGRLAVQRADAHNLLPAETYGSRPGRRANICALNKVLTYDIIRQRKYPSALCSNDAVACYDRIVHSIASICMQRVGIAAETCHMMFGTLQLIQHYISTAYGLSDSSYGALEIPLQGVGQGNGAGPAIWLIMSIPLINQLRSKGFGFRSTTVLSSESYRFVCYTFVDDTDTIHSVEDHHATPARVIAEMQQAINTWEGGLRATGGALSIDKSYWYFIAMEWNYNKQKWSYKSMDDSPGSLTILGDSTIPLPLTRHDINHAEETLGLWIAPNANQTAQVLALQNKILKWSDKIRTRQLSSSLAWLFLTSGVSMALKYPMSATNLSQKECKQITKPFLDLALPAMGLPRRMPHAILFSPKEYLGYGLFDIWLTQNVDQIQVCLEYGHQLQGDITGHLLRDVSETLRMEIGMPHSPLGYDYKRLHLCTTRTKLHTIWEFCSDTGLTLKDGVPDLPVLRANDRFLMSVFYESNQYTPKQLSILNLCRRHLQVSLLSDLCTGDGKSLHPGCLDRRQPYLHRLNTTHCPPSGAPNPHAWRMWRDALIKCFLPVNSISNRLLLPLGAWLLPPALWQWYYSPDLNLLYRLSLDHTAFSVFRPTITRRRTRQTFFQQDHTTPSLPNLPTCALPTTVFGTARQLQHTGISSFLPHPPTVPTPHAWSHGTVIQAPTNLHLLIMGIVNHTAIALTDGSYKDGLGTAGLILLSDVDENQNDAFILANQTPGDPVDMDAYRSELAGLFGIIHLTHELCNSFPITNGGSITIGCDCLSAINNITSKFEPNPQRPHHDLLSGIRHLITTSTIRIHLRHVRGHQDAHFPYHMLDKWSQLNVDMDTLAKAHWEVLHHRPATTRPFHLPAAHGQWSIWHGEYRFPCWTLPRAQSVYHRAASTNFWNKRLDNPTALQSFDWPGSSLALRLSPTHQRLWIPKWICSTLPIGKNLVRWGQPPLMLACPRCGQDESHLHHVITCPHPGAAGIRALNLEKIEAYLDTSATEPDLKAGFLSLLESLFLNEPWQPPPTSDPGVYATFQEQQRLGCHHVLDGFLSPTWAFTQQQFYLSLERRNTGLRWSSRLVRMIWQIAWDLWLHRRRIKESTESHYLPAIHENLNSAIDSAFTSFRTTNDPSLARWFSRSPQILHSESIDWKTRWLEMVTPAVPPEP
jgi:hypothetical protein